MSIVFLSIAVIFGIAAVHPFTTYPLSLALAKRISKSGRTDNTDPALDKLPTSCAVCLCAYNEAKPIRDRIENLLDIREFLAKQNVVLNIFAYSDGCSDNTASILQSYGDKIHLIVSETRTGKSVGMNTLLQQVQDPFVIFTDANVEYELSAIPRLLQRFSDPSVGCVVGHLKYTNENESATATTNSFYWRFEENLKQQESDTGSVMGADGSIFAIRRTLFREVPPDIIDDMFTSMSIVCDGYRIVRAGDAVAYERTAATLKEEYRRKVRIACRNFNCFRLLRPRLLRLNLWNLYKYVSHRFLRWLFIFSLLGSMLFFILAAFAIDNVVGTYTLLALAIITALSLLLRKARLCRSGWEAFAAFYAVGVGVILSLRGERFRTWEPPASARN